MGRPRKPLEEKRRLGNLSKVPLPNPVTSLKPVDVKVITNDGPRDGDELVQALMAAGAATWIGETDALATLRLVRDAWDERQVLRDLIAKHGYTDVATSDRGGSRPIARPEVAMLRDVEKQITVWLGQLGLNPSDRGRLGLAEVRAKATGLSALREERALKAGRHAG